MSRYRTIFQFVFLTLCERFSDFNRPFILHLLHLLHLLILLLLLLLLPLRALAPYSLCIPSLYSDPFPLICVASVSFSLLSPFILPLRVLI